MVERRARRAVLVIVSLLAVIGLAAFGPGGRSSVADHHHGPVNPPPTQAPGSTEPEPEPVVTIQILPEEVVLAPGERVSVRAVLVNPGAAAVDVTRFDLIVPPGLSATRVDDAPAVPFPLPPRAGRVEEIVIEAGSRVETGSVSVLAETTAAAEPVVLTGTWKVTAAAPVDGLSVEVLSAPAKLSDGNAGLVAVRVANTSTWPLRNVQVSGVDGRDVCFLGIARGDGAPTPEADERGCPGDGSSTPPLSSAMFALEPGEARVITFSIAAAGAVHTGSTTLSVVARGTPSHDGSGQGVRSVSASAKTSIDVSVFGVDVLSPVGLGGLFLVPGLIAIAVALALARVLYPRTKLATPDLKSPGVLLVAAVIGLLVYLLVWLIWRTNLARDGMSTGRVVLLCAFGAGVGFIGWAVYAWLHRRYVGRKQFQVDDTPIQVLERLALRGQSLIRPVHLQGRLLGANADGAIALCSAIEYGVSDGLADSKLAKAIHDARERGDAGAVARLLKDPAVAVSFADAAGVILLKTPPTDTATATQDLTEEVLVAPHPIAGAQGGAP